MTEILVDWCSYRFRGRHIDNVLESLGWSIEDMEKHDRGGYGYERCLERDHARIYYKGREDMGVLVWLPGQACRLLEDRPIFFTWQAWIGDLLRQGARVTRFDLAIDERSGLLDLEEIERKIRAGEWCGKARDYQTIASTSPLKGEGRTVYVGSTSSPVRVRIYDKAAKENEEGHWTRVELQLRKERAHEVASRFAGTVSAADEKSLIQGVLRTYLDFKVPGEGVTPSRWATSPWWEQFIESAEKVSIAGGVAEDSIARRRTWLLNQVAPSLALVWAAEGNSIQFLLDLVQAGLERIPAKLWKLVEERKLVLARNREKMG